jgi:hypothetical protein
MFFGVSEDALSVRKSNECAVLKELFWIFEIETKKFDV